MKRMKKLLAVMMAAIMVMAMGIVNVSAADNTEYTITIDNATEGYTYVAYQIFAGDLSIVDDESTLSNVEFGSALSANDQAKLLQYYVDQSILDGTKYEKSAAGLAAALGDGKITAADFAEKLATYELNSAASSEYQSGDANYTIKVTGAGYYLVKNTVVPSGNNTAYSDYILEVVESVKVDPKSSVPEVEKKVQEVNDTTGYTSDWQDAADYDIGDSINYKLTGTMPSTLATYTSYYYLFTDTLSKGLTYTSDSAVVTLYDSADDVGVANKGVDITSQCTISTADYDGSKSAYTDGTVLTVAISDVFNLSGVTVTKDSVIVVTYSATLNDSAVVGENGNPNEVVLTYSNNPNDTDGKGTTPEDKVTVFTFELDVNKVNGSGNALKGAGFTLYKYDKKEEDYVAVGSEVTGTDTDITTFTFKGLDTGKYKIVETTTPNGYNTADPIYFQIVAEYENGVTDPKLTSLTVMNEAGDTDLTEGADASFTAIQSTGILSTNVVNNSGSILPSTGGIGTTIFYIVGAILVLGAGVILVTRRRTTSR